MGVIIHTLVSRLSTTHPLTPTYPAPPPASSSSSSLTLTVLFFFLLLLFIVFFSIFARRLFLGAHFPSASTPRPPPPPSLLSHLRYLGSATGLDPTAVRALPVLTYAEWRRRSRTSKEAGGGECVVCLGELEDEWVKVIPGCGHVFHPCCIDGWLVLHGSCPICRCSRLLAGAGAGAGAGEVRVDLGGGPREGEMVGLGRSRSLGCCREEGSRGEGGAGLRRSWSCSG